MEFHPVLERLDRFLAAKPVISEDVYIAPNATILGKVSIRSESSVWFQSVIRAAGIIGPGFSGESGAAVDS